MKPAHEPICLARKPLFGTVAACVLTHGTGALNIDGTRIESSDTAGKVWTRGGNQKGPGLTTNTTGEHEYLEANAAGRWPANVVCDETAATILDRQSGTLTSGSRAEGVRTGLGYHGANGDGGPAIEGNSGGASRFFYCAKAGAAEKPWQQIDGDDEAHPTVKPLALMRWLVRLVTPPGGLILDPFAGTGTTGEAAVIEGMRAVLVEEHEPYMRLIRQRLSKPLQPTMFGG